MGSGFQLLLQQNFQLYSGRRQTGECPRPVFRWPWHRCCAASGMLFHPACRQCNACFDTVGFRWRSQRFGFAGQFVQQSGADGKLVATGQLHNLAGIAKAGAHHHGFYAVLL
jgi:hypothetical protein